MMWRHGWKQTELLETKMEVGVNGIFEIRKFGSERFPYLRAEAYAPHKLVGVMAQNN